MPKGAHITPPLDFRPRRFEAAVNAAVQKRWKPHVVHGSYFTSPKVPGANTMVTIYDFIYEEFPSLTGAYEYIRATKRLAMEAADCIVAISNATRESACARIRGAEKKTRVIYPGVSEAFLAPRGDAAQARAEFRAAAGNDRPYWLFVGNRGGYKNFGALVRAFAGVAKRVEADLVLMGGEYELSAWEIDLLLSKGLEGRVHLLGPVSDSLLVAGYAGAAAFVFPSCAEGFGIPLLEAMACGTPVLAADIPVFREVAAGNADFFDPHDQGALEEMLLAALSKPAEPARLEAARRHAAGFTWDKAAVELAEAYRWCADT